MTTFVTAAVGYVVVSMLLVVARRRHAHYTAVAARLNTESAELEQAHVDARIADLERAFGEST